MPPTGARVPLADSYITDKINSTGMHARPVVGGIFIKMLSDDSMWKKWSTDPETKAGNWAPLPEMPKLNEVVPTSRHTPVTWHYTTQRPPQNWAEPTFDDSSWKQGPGGFGTRGPPDAVVGTVWNTADIWLRRTFTVPQDIGNDPQLIVYHDEDVQIYINGVLAAAVDHGGRSAGRQRAGNGSLSDHDGLANCPYRTAHARKCPARSSQFWINR